MNEKRMYIAIESRMITSIKRIKQFLRFGHFLFFQGWELQSETNEIKPYGYIAGVCLARCAAQLVDLSVLSRSEN